MARQNEVISDADHKRRAVEIAKDERDEAKELEAARKNSRFVQLSEDFMDAHAMLCMHHPRAAGLLSFIGKRMGRQNSLIVGYQTLCELTGLKRSTLAAELKYLRDHNWIASIKIGSATAFVVNSNVMWKAWNNNKKYALFTATVIASEDENRAELIDAQLRKLKHFPLLEAGERVIVGGEPKDPPAQTHLDIA